MNNIEIPRINLQSFKNLKNITIVYDDGVDTLYVRPRLPRSATSYDWQGEIWLRVDIETGDVVGLEIADFENVFLKKHPELAPAWREAKKQCHHKRIKKEDKECWESFIRMIFEFFQELFKAGYQQASPGIL